MAISLSLFGSFFLSDVVMQICTYIQLKQKVCRTDEECGVGEVGCKGSVEWGGVGWGV